MKFGALFSKIKPACLAPSADGSERMIASPWGTTCTGRAGDTAGAENDPRPEKTAPNAKPQMGLWEALCRAKFPPSEKHAPESPPTLSSWGALSMSRL